MITGIRFSTSEFVISKEGLKKNGLADLKTGQVLDAKVLKVLANGTALLKINGRVMSAKTNLILNPEEQIQLSVQSQKDEIVLKLVQPESKVAPAGTGKPFLNARLLATRIHFSDLSDLHIDTIKDALFDLSLKSSKADPDFLPRLIEKSGLLLEKQLDRLLQTDLSFSQNQKAEMGQLLKSDFKAILLNEFKTPGIDARTAEKISSALKTIEVYQQLNLHSSDAGKYLLPLPFLSDSAFRFGQLLIDTGATRKADHTGSGDKMIGISFLLDMTRLGPLRADFSILKKTITGRFMLADDAVRQYIASGLPELKKRLTSIEFQPIRIDCITASLDKIEKNSLVDALTKDQDSHVLNIVI